MKIVSSKGLLAALGLICVTAGGINPAIAQQDGRAQQVTSSDGGGGGPQQPISPSYRPTAPVVYTSSLGSTYVPMDSWMYPALDRLHSLGYLDTAFLGLRPWTRQSILHMLEESADRIDANTGDDEAREIFLKLREELSSDEQIPYSQRVAHAEFESVYTNLRGISGTPLNDSFHLGQTIVDDYGRPYQEGFNNYTGFSARAEAGRFTLYFRGEYQHAPSAAGYPLAMAQYLSYNIDYIPWAGNSDQATIPLGPIATKNDFRVMEATLSYHLLGHEVSFGKQDHWLSPAQGGAMSWSNNAENIYSFDINRVEPLRVPGLSRLTGPFRYEFFVGSLKGHTAPNDPWVHTEKISLKPTKNLELGFERTTIWGGKGHTPITLHTFLKSFFSVQNVTAAEKFGRDDPGARFGSFDFNYRLPFVRNWLTLYSDSVDHDDVNPISAPRRSGVRPGLYLSHFPVLTHLDMRVEGFSTDPVSNASANGNFLYYEGIQKQGPTNKGNLFADNIGRDAKGGQAWLTYHLSPNENVQVSYRDLKGDTKFIPGGTTQNDYSFSVTKRFMKDLEVHGWVQYERWVAPFYKPGPQSDTVAAAQITWYPKSEKAF
ncbi:capsule assembly Wzi family protein [Silvibacterium acidisoli]|uniref:capsule assembly Wzi family protein n=1 Tax=Acidobacteriaceae bacterium ZG23-2 TaxID=2883246 RepID=UPI00406C2471